MPGIIDADTHVAEPLEMWDHLDPEWYARRPIVVKAPNDTLYKGSNHMWLIDGSIFPRSSGRGGSRLVTPTSQDNMKNRPDRRSRELLDLEYRFSDMAATKVDTHVVYPTLFLAFLTHDPELEVALARAYNRFMAEVWAKSGGRIRWVVVPALRDIDASIAELRFGKANGACGIFFRGIEKDRMLDDPYFFPLYEEAQALGLSVDVHQGQGAPALNGLIDIDRSATFTHGRIPPISAFRNIVANRIPELFPTLRFGFIETGASWIPFALHQLKGTMRTDPDFWGPRLFDEYNIWVSYEVDEDLPYLLKFTGEDHMVAGTDYGHHPGGELNTDRLASDPSAQFFMVDTLYARDDVPKSVIDKMLTDNAAALYGID